MKYLIKIIKSVCNNKSIQKFFRHRSARIGFIILVIEVIMFVFIPVVMNLDPYAFNTSAMNQAPSINHWFGTDNLGRDMFARVVYGGRTSLLIGIASNLVGLAIGLPLGVLAGYYRGFCEFIVMRTSEIFMSVPSMIFIIVLAAVFQPTIGVIIVIIGVFFWTGYARIIYTNVLSVRSREYVEASRVIGVRDFKIMFRDILPNSIAPIWIVLSGSIAQGILMEATLSYMGVGIKAPEPSLGNIIYLAQTYSIMTQKPWIWMPAGVVLVLTVISVNLMGDGIRDILDPRYTD